jgi:hypothetical protein
MVLGLLKLRDVSTSRRLYYLNYRHCSRREWDAIERQILVVAITAGPFHRFSKDPIPEAWIGVPYFFDDNISDKHKFSCWGHLGQRFDSLNIFCKSWKRDDEILKFKSMIKGFTHVNLQTGQPSSFVNSPNFFKQILHDISLLFLTIN